MKLRTAGRHAKEGFKNIIRNGWMTFASVSAVTVSLVLVGLFLSVMLNLNSIANQLENDVEVRVYIEMTASQKQEEQLRKSIEELKQVQSVKYQSRQEGFRELKESLGDDAAVISSLKDKSFLPNAFIIKTENPEQVPKVAEKVKDMKGAYQVEYGKGKVEKLFTVVDVSRNVGIVLIVGLLFTSIFLITNTIKLTIVARRREIEIMKLVGATNAFVRWPFFMEGLYLGILGAALPIALVAFGYRFLYEQFIASFNLFVELIPYQTMTMYLGGLLLVMGALIGMLGSINSVRKFLKV